MLRSPLKMSGLQAARFLTLLTCFAALLLVVFAAGFQPKAEAKSAQRLDLGQLNYDKFVPNCGSDFSRDCLVEGKVTAFQALTNRYPARNFVVPFDGKLISWSISLAQPTRTDIEGNQAQLPAFNLIFGSPSQAGISILRQVQKNKKGAPRFKLVRRSPVQILNPYFGKKVTFALEKPLNVYKDNVIALTIPTWAPALWQPKVCNYIPAYGDVSDPEKCENAHKRFTWRGSRMPRGEDKCALRNIEGVPNEALEKTRPQVGLNSVRGYGCYYGGSVLLYSATIVGR